MQMASISQTKKTEIVREKSLDKMTPLTNLRTVCLLRKWHILNQTEALHQVSIKNIVNNYNNVVIFCVNIVKNMETKNLNSRLHNANYRCCFFDGATLKHSHHIRPTLNEINLIMDIVLSHMITDHITKLEVNKDLLADSIINVAKE